MNADGPVQAADWAVYEAKQGGRGRVFVSGCLERTPLLLFLGVLFAALRRADEDAQGLAHGLQVLRG